MVNNRPDHPTSLHWHGISLRNDMDGADPRITTATIDHPVNVNAPAGQHHPGGWGRARPPGPTVQSAGTITLCPASMRQAACLSCKLLVNENPAGLPQAGTLMVFWLVPARVFGSHVLWAVMARGTVVPSGQTASEMPSIVHCPLTNRAWWPCDAGSLTAIEAHPSPHGVAYQSSVPDSPVEVVQVSM
jgi:hypothetical protein